MDVIALARDLKSRAMNERDMENWEGALELLAEARSSLEQALETLADDGSAKDAKLLEFESSVRKALYGMLGSIGGVYRRRAASDDRLEGDLAAAIDCYDQGRELEKQFTDSYNLTQRLVTRVLLDPAAALDEGGTVAGARVLEELRAARRTIGEQTATSGPRSKDEYAFADAAVVALLLGETQWTDAVADFTRLASKSSYARNVTLDLLKELDGGLACGEDAAVRSLHDRLELALKLAS